MNLSICIPTFNRKDYLKENILEIIKQAEENEISVEICISDNDSTDGTDIMISEIDASQFITLKYAKNEKNIGPDLNYLRVVELASRDFCWFLGSDDIIAPGSLIQMNKLINSSKSDILLFNRIDCDLNMNEFGRTKWNDFEEKYTVNLNDEKDLINYFSRCNSLGGIFSFLSSIVFRLSTWKKIKYDEKFTGTAYSHVFMLLGFGKHKGELTVYPDFLILCRHGNDHFLKDGFVRRFQIDINGYLLLANTLFDKHSKVYNSFLSIMKREHDFFYLNFIKSKSDTKTWQEIKRKLKLYNFDSFLLIFITISPRLVNLFLFRLSVVFKKLNL